MFIHVLYFYNSLLQISAYTSSGKPVRKSRQSTLRRVDYFNDFFLFRFWRMVAVTRTSSTLFIRFLYYNVQSLLGVIFDLVGIIFFLTDCSNYLLLFTQGYGEVSLSKHRVLFSQFLWTQYTELAGYESELDYCFLPSSLARFIFPF